MWQSIRRWSPSRRVSSRSRYRAFVCARGVFAKANSVVAVVLAIGCGVLTVVRPEYGLTLLTGELLIGSKEDYFALGAMRKITGVPIRILLFVGFLLGWLIWSLRQKPGSNGQRL